MLVVHTVEFGHSCAFAEGFPSHAKEPGIFGGANGFSSSFLISSDCYVGVLDLNTLSFTHWVQADLMQNDTPDEDSLIYEFSDVYNILAAGMAGDTIVFYGIARDVMDYSVGLFHLSFNEFTGDRTKVSIGALLDDSLFHLNELVDYYNRMQDKVYIEIRDYTESTIRRYRVRTTGAEALRPCSRSLPAIPDRTCIF